MGMVVNRIVFIATVVGACVYLVSCRVSNYRSIDDSGPVEFDPEITNIVGVTGSGKTSFLKMLSGVSSRVQSARATCRTTRGCSRCSTTAGLMQARLFT